MGRAKLRMEILQMGRAKLRMEIITKEKTRNTTYQKRKLGIMKKANEFTILCDVDTVIIIYPPDSNNPEIWPENPDKIKKTIASYKSKKGETGKRTYDLNDFFEDRKKKIEDELVKARRKNMEARYSTWFDDLNSLPEVQLRQFAMGLENKENIVRAHLEFKKRNMNFQMPFMFDLQNKQPMAHYSDMGSPPSFDHVQVMNHQPMMNHPSFDHVQVMNHQPMMNHDLGWFNDTTMASFIPLKREPMMGFVYPMFDGGMVNDNLNNQWAFPPPSLPADLMPDSAMQDVGSQVNVGVGDLVMDDHRGRFFG